MNASTPDSRQFNLITVIQLATVVGVVLVMAAVLLFAALLIRDSFRASACSTTVPIEERTEATTAECFERFGIAYP